MKKILIIILLFLININHSFAGLVLQDVINIAIESNEELKASEYSYKAARSEKLKSIGGFLPQISLNVDTGSRKTKIGENNRINDDVDKKRFSASQNIFNGFGTIFEVKKSNNIANKELAIKNSKIQEISLNVIRYYLDILRYQHLIKVSGRNLKSQGRLLYYIDKKFKVKDSTKSELARARADYIKAKNDKLQNENNLFLVKSNLSRYSGIDISEINNLEDNFIFKKEDRNTEQLFKIALELNPQIQISKNSFLASKHQSNIAKSSLSPKVTLNFDISEEKNSLYLNNQKERDTSIYLNFNVPIFNSGQNYFDIAANNNYKKKERFNYEAVKKQVYNSLIEYQNKISNYDASYSSAKSLERANRVYLNTLKQEERLGTKSIIELLEARQNFYDSQIQRINIYYDRVYCYFEFKSLIAELL
mgnify:CR=1 FL=1